MSRTLATRRTFAGVNLQNNGSFEDTPATNVAQTQANWINGTSTGIATKPYSGAWALPAITSGSGSAMYDNSFPHSGAYALKISTTATASALYCSNWEFSTNADLTPVNGSTTYTVSFWLKVTLNSGACNSGALMLVSEKNSALTNLGNHTTAGIHTTQGYAQQTITFTTQSATVAIEIRPGVTGSDGAGTAIIDSWWDDILVYPTGQPPRTLAVGRTLATGRTNT